MSGRYAAKTAVSVERSRNEIESTLAWYGAKQFMYGWKHTNALWYSLLERLHLRLFGHWPERVVDRRLAAYDLDVKESAERWAHD